MGYSTDFKEKVLEIMIRDKMSVRKAALYFGVCTRSIQQWKKSTVAKPIPGRKPKISTEEINASLSEINSVMNEAKEAMENQVNLSNRLEKSVEKFTL